MQVVLLPNEYFPGGHTVGADVVSGQALPGGQAMQVLPPAKLYRPETQGTGFEEVETQANPAVQGLHGSVGDVVYSPFAQTVQFVEPFTEKLPAEQENRWFPGCGQKLPAGHKEHVDDAGEEYSPLGHEIWCVLIESGQ